jgi:hypothetical protein
MSIKFPELIGVKFHFEEGATKIIEWAEKYALPESARERLASLCGLALKKTIDGLFTGEFNYDEVKEGLKVWVADNGLSEEAIDELAGICDFIFEFTGLAGIPAEIADGKLFKFIFNKVKDLLFKS